MLLNISHEPTHEIPMTIRSKLCDYAQISTSGMNNHVHVLVALHRNRPRCSPSGIVDLFRALQERHDVLARHAATFIVSKSASDLE